MTAEKVTKNKIVLTRRDAKRLAQVGLSASSKDDVTPVLCAANIIVDGREARVVCTDRYRVHTSLIQLEEKAKAHEFMIPREALTWLDKNVGTWGRFQIDAQGVVITTTSTGALTIAVFDRMEGDGRSVTWNGQVTIGKFPPILTLLVKARDAETGEPGRVDMNFLRKVSALSEHLDAPLVRFTQAPEDSKRPGPLYISFGEPDAPYAEALIQPRLNVAS